MTMLGTVASAQTSITLGTAAPYAVLAGERITNTGPSTIDGDVGLSPGTAITGMDEATVNGTTNATNAAAQQAQADLTIAYDQAESQPPSDTVNYAQLGEREPLTSGTYNATSSMNLTGTVTLDGENDPNAVFIFQAGSTLVTASNSTVDLINGANPCNVFWQVGSSATLGVGTDFVGTVMTSADITANTGATVQGRLLAQTAGAVTLDTNTINALQCAPPTTTTTPTTPPTSEPSETTEPTTPTTTETTDLDDSTTPTTTGPSEPTTPTTSVPTPTTTVPTGAPVIPILPILLPAVLIGGSVAAAPVVGPMIGQFLGGLGIPLPALPDFPPLAGSAMPGPAPLQPVARAPMAPGPETPNGRGGEPGVTGDVTGPATAETAVLMTGSVGDFELPLPAGVRLPPLPFIR